MKWVLLICTCFLLNGCNSNINQEQLQIVPLKNQILALEVSSQIKNQKMMIREKVEGGNVYVECVISDFDFSKRGEDQSGDGFLNLYLNGKKVDEIYTAAFVIKGLPTGKHHIKLELVHNDGSSYGIEKDFEVTVS